MGTNGVTTAADSDGGTVYRLPRVALFASGNYRGRDWPPSLIRALVIAGKRLGPDGLNLLVPPAVLGHEEEQEWLDRTDLPAAGWVDPTTLTAEPDLDNPGHLILVGDIVNIPGAVADRIRDGEFANGSAEIYDDFFDDFGHSHGPSLRRFALLGGEVPQVKRLGRLPDPVPMSTPCQFSETPTPQATTLVFTFAERTAVDRTQMIAAIQAAMPGLSQSTLDALDDTALADLVKNIPTPVATPVTPPAVTPPPGVTTMADRATMIQALADAGQDPAVLETMDDVQLQSLYDQLEMEPEEVETMGDPAVMTREELIAELVAAGQDQAMLDGLDDQGLRDLYTSLGLGATATTPAAAPATSVAPAATMADRKKTCYSERATVRRIVPKAKTLLAKLNRMSERAARAERKAVIDPVCKDLVRAGFTPAFVNEWIRPNLERLDNDKAVIRFSEGGRTTVGTALQAKIAAAKALNPAKVVVKFGERFAGPDLVPQTTAQDEAAKVREFAATLSDSTLRAAGYTSREQMVQKFSETRKKVPGLTAKQYLGI